MRLILVRHGYTDALKNQTVQGNLPIPLNRRGIFQAKKVAEVLRTMKISHLYSSNTLRAHQTALYIAKHHSHRQLVVTPLLREKDTGPLLEGKSWKYVRRAMKKKFFDHYYRPRGGESWADASKRAVGVLKTFRRRHPRGTVLIVSHGGFIRMMLTYIFHGRTDQYQPAYHHNNTGVTIVTWRSGKPKILKLNDLSHLTKKTRTH